MKTIIRAVVVCAVLFSGAVFADGADLFPSAASAPLTTAERNMLAANKARASDRGHRTFPMNRFALDSNVITFTLDGKTYVVPGKKTIDGEFTSWGGSIYNPKGYSILLTLTRGDKSGTVSGTLEVNGKNYLIRPLSADTIVLFEQDEPRVYDDPRKTPLPPPMQSKASAPAKRVSLQDPTPPAIPNVRILTVYIQGADQHIPYGRTPAEATAGAVASLNGILSASQVPMTVSNAGMAIISNAQFPGGALSQHSDVLETSYFNMAIASARDAVSADYVMIVSGQADAAGYAGISNIFDAGGVRGPHDAVASRSVIDVAAFDNTFLHEFGHGMGVRHERNAAPYGTQTPDDMSGDSHAQVIRQNTPDGPACFHTIGGSPSNSTQSVPAITVWRFDPVNFGGPDGWTGQEACTKAAAKYGFVGTWSPSTSTLEFCTKQSNGYMHPIGLRTIPAGPVTCTESLISRFSNPNVSWLGVPTGTAGTNNSARVMGANAVYISTLHTISLVGIIKAMDAVMLLQFLGN